MRIIATVFAVTMMAASVARGDSLTESAQQTLKDQGFYYGEVTGRNDTDTIAAIRRYQIRNGLKITGEINSETMKSLGLKGNLPPAATPAPVAHVTPPPVRNAPVPEPPELRDQTFPSPPPPAIAVIFAGTPYERALPNEQQRVIVAAQSLLARKGYYRSAIDGVFGPGMEFALRAYQTRFGLGPSGRLDMETLAVLGLLPRQRAPGLTAPLMRQPRLFTPRGERVYTPR